MLGREFSGKKKADTASAIEKLREELTAADAVIIGAGAGLSTSAGLTYTGERFHKYFQEFIDKYGFLDMYSGGFYLFGTLEEYWAYWSRYIYINRYADIPKPVYTKLYELVKDKDYFVLTTNVDHCFQRTGFDKKRLFYTQGDFGLWQCSKPCHQKNYDNEAVIHRMLEQQKNMKVTPDLVPYCPICGEPMSMNLRADDTFVEDEGWHLAAKRYSEFLHGHRNKKALFLELGTGMNTPAIVKYPFWRMLYQWPTAIYACINLNEAYAPKEIERKSICINDDIGNVLEKI